MIQAPRAIFAMHAVPYSLLIASFVVSVSLVFLGWLGWALWLVAVLVIVAWLPVFVGMMNKVYRQYGKLALLLVLVIGQTLHLGEHIAQMVEAHILGWQGARASGLIGTLNNEWVHFLWNTWVLLFAVWLISLFRKNFWMMSLFIFSIWHEIEHIYIMSVYLRTHIEGTPGLIARGGLIGGGLPIARLDLHFLYAVFEEVLLLLAYYQEAKKSLNSTTHQLETAAAISS